MSEDLVIINKPIGMTSHDVVNRVRRKTGVKRVGHAGTLDPLASGILILLIGREMTKRQAEFMGLPKVYEAEITFGSVSETGDAEGPIAQRATLEQLQKLSESDVRAVLPQFVGTIKQKPPAHSAIKVAGQPLYKRARKGTVTDADLLPREVTIDSIDIINFVPATPPFPPTARIKVACQKGVYIRSLAADIGEVLGVGAYLSQLARTQVGQYSIDTALTLEQFEAA